MEIKRIETLKDLKELYDCSALTWEGMNENYFENACAKCSMKGKDGTIYLTSGQKMNELCHLTGNNAYPDDLNIVSIEDYNCVAISVDGRWMDDIIDNNARRESYHPFK